MLCHSSSAERALKESKQVVFEALCELEGNGEPIPEPFSLRSFSGKFVVRTTEDLHRSLTMEAQEKGVPINKLVNEKLSG